MNIKESSREGPAVPDLLQVEFYIEAAQKHGETSDPDHEVGDLQDLLRAAWGVFSIEQKLHFAASPDVQSTLEGALAHFSRAGHEAQLGKLRAQVASDPRSAARLLIEAINATGGIVTLKNGQRAPKADREWVDLVDAYLRACAEVGTSPMVEAAAPESEMPRRE